MISFHSAFHPSTSSTCSVLSFVFVSLFYSLSLFFSSTGGHSISCFSPSGFLYSIFCLFEPHFWAGIHLCPSPLSAPLRKNAVHLAEPLLRIHVSVSSRGGHGSSYPFRACGSRRLNYSGHHGRHLRKASTRTARGRHDNIISSPRASASSKNPFALRPVPSAISVAGRSFRGPPYDARILLPRAGFPRAIYLRQQWSCRAVQHRR